VLLIVVDKPGEKPFYLISLSLAIPVTRLIRAWTQRHWIEQMFRLLINQKRKYLYYVRFKSTFVCSK
jgi:hypothetical protein